MEQEFDAILTGRGPGGGWTFLPVPFDVQAVFGSKALLFLEEGKKRLR